MYFRRWSLKNTWRQIFILNYGFVYSLTTHLYITILLCQHCIIIIYLKCLLHYYLKLKQASRLHYHLLCVWKSWAWPNSNYVSWYRSLTVVSEWYHDYQSTRNKKNAYVTTDDVAVNQAWEININKIYIYYYYKITDVCGYCGNWESVCNSVWNKKFITYFNSSIKCYGPLMAH